MVFTEALRMLITADTRGAVQSIEALGKSTDKSLGGNTKTIDKWSRGLTVAGAGMVAFGSAALVGLGMAAKSASDLGEAVNATEVTFGSASGTIDKFAEDSATNMGLSERAFRQALVPIGAMLQNFGFSQEEAADQSVKLAQRAADMASVFNTDVATALEAIQAGLRGESDPLEKFGVGLNEAAVNAKAMELGLADSTTEVDASAKAQARLAIIFEQTSKFQGDFANTSDSLANRQRILAAQFENLKAAIGEGALPVFETFVGAASKAVGVFESLSPSTQNAIGKFATFGSVALIAAGGLSFLTGQALKAAQNFGAARDAIAKFTGPGGVGGLAKTVGKGGLVVGGMFALGEAINAIQRAAAPAEADIGKLETSLRKFERTGQLTGEGARILGDNLGGLKEAWSDLFDPSTTDRAEHAADAVINVSAEVLTFGQAAVNTSTDLNKAKDRIDDFDQALADLASSDPDQAFEVLKAVADELGVSIDDLMPRLDDYNAVVDKTKEDAAGAGEAVGEFGQAMGDSAEDTEEATSALQAYSDHLRAMTDPIFAAMDAITGVRDAQLAEKDAAVAVMEAQAALNEARAAGDPAAIAEAERGLADAQRELSDAQWNTVTSASEADAALAGLQDAVERGDVSVDTFRDTLATWVRQGFLTQDQADRAAASVGGLADAAAEADRQRVDIPVTVHTGNAHNTIRVLQQRIDSLTGKTVTVSVVASYTASASNALQTFGGRQAGGGVVPRYMQSGGVNWNWGRGPRGTDTVPAWLTPGEMVLNQGQQANLFNLLATDARFGGGYVDNRQVHYHIAGQDPQGTVEAIKRYERMNGPGWRS